jgi:hypothetical protein
MVHEIGGKCCGGLTQHLQKLLFSQKVFAERDASGGPSVNISLPPAAGSQRVERR